MPSVSRETAIVEDHGPVVDRHQDLGDTTVQFITFNADADGTPLRDGRGRLRVRLAGGQGSHVLSALAAADALAVIPEPLERADAGTEVELRWLDRG